MSVLRGRSAVTAARKNKIINGDFNVQLRSSTVNNYTIDRWISNGGGGHSRQFFTLGQTAVPGEPTCFYRHNQTANALNVCVTQLIESVRTLAGQQAVLSFWAKGDKNLTVTPVLRQHFGTGGTPSANVDISSATTPTIAITTSWQRFEIPFAVPSLAGKTIGVSGTDHLAVRFNLPVTFFQFDIARVQLEAGSSATDFEDRDPGTEAALCLRYYQETRLDWYGTTTAGGNYRASVSLPNPMRAFPTVTGVNLANGSFPVASAIYPSFYPGGVINVLEDRVANASGNNGSFATTIRCDAELLEA